MWLLTRAISLTFWHSPPEEYQSNKNYCVAAFFRNIPLYFLTQAASVVVVQLWGDFKHIDTYNVERRRMIERKKYIFFVVFFVSNTILSIISSIAGCKNPESLITP